MPEDRPSFPFYAKDYLASARVSAMPLAAQGLYVRLIAFSWLSDGLPGDEDALRRLAGVERFEWRRVWPLVAPMWERRDTGRLYQRKLEAVRQATTDYTEARREAGRRGGRSSVEARREAHGTAQPRSNPEANAEAKTNPSFAVASAVASSEATPPPPPAGGDRGLFARFWAAYPRRIGKKAAEKAFDRLAVDAALLEVMLAALAWQCRQDAWTKDGAGFVPHAATWLNGRRWEDEPTGRTSGAVSTSVPVIDPDYNGAPYRVHCDHTPTCTTWPQCRDAARADESRTA